MDERAILKERAQNIWASFARKTEALAQSAHLEPIPDFPLGRIGGLDAAKEEIQTYACAATSRDVYQHWGTYPPTAVLLIGGPGVGKSLLARALACLTNTSFLVIGVPRLVIEVIHRGGQVGELLQGWSQILGDLPPTTVLFEELEFSQAREIGANRPDLPVGPIMDLLLDMVDRAVAVEDHLVLGSTSHPDTLRQAFVMPKRFERVVEVNPIFPDDIVAALAIHAAEAEKRAGHPLFSPIEWEEVVSQHRGPSTGDWIHVLHAVLRRKARYEASGESPGPVTTEDVRVEVQRHTRAADRITPPTGNYV